MKAIKLYAKLSIEYKVKDRLEGDKILREIYDENIFFKSQDFSATYFETNRKRNKYNLIITFYELKTLKEMIDDKIYALEEIKNETK